MLVTQQHLKLVVDPREFVQHRFEQKLRVKIHLFVEEYEHTQV